MRRARWILPVLLGWFAACAASRVTVAGGKLEMDEGQVQVEVAPFQVDPHAVTVEEYRRCVAAGACAGDKLGGHQWSGQPWEADPLCHAGAGGPGLAPVNCVTWHEAAAYCAWRSARLPTDAERSLLDRSARGEAHAQLFCRNPGRDNPFNLCDVGGGVGTWTTASTRAPAPSERAVHPPDDRSPALGIRCVESLEADPTSEASTGVPARLVGGTKIIQVRPKD